MMGYATIRAAHRYGLGIDACGSADKWHLHRVARLGGIPVAAGLAFALAVMAALQHGFGEQAVCLLLVLLPALSVGLVEDLTQKLGTLVRLGGTALAAALGWFLLDARLLTLDLWLFDLALTAHMGVAFVFTLFAAAGVSHALNIVDGCNGLSSFVGMVILTAIAAMAYAVGDDFVFVAASLGAASVLGFFFWNFPFGRLFLGDGGAYTLGLLVAELSLMLVCRNPSVSPWFPLVLAIYPVWETLFSAYRRVVLQGRSPGSADRLHLHSLVYHRLARALPNGVKGRLQPIRSSVAAMYMWPLALGCALTALLLWDRPHLLKLSALAFGVGYVLLYNAIVRRCIPRALAFRARGALDTAGPAA